MNMVHRHFSENQAVFGGGDGSPVEVTCVGSSVILVMNGIGLRFNWNLSAIGPLIFDLTGFLMLPILVT